MDPVAILQHIFQVAQLIHTQAALSQANQKQVRRLAERVQMVVASVKGLGELPNNRQFIDSLKALNRCLDEIHDYVKQFAEAGVLRRFFMAGNYRDAFADYNQRLADLLPQLNVGLAAHAILNHEQDLADQEKDRAFVASQLGAIRGQQERLLREVQAARLDPRVLEGIIARQMESFCLRIQGYVRGDAVPKALISKDYDVNFCDIIFNKKIGQGSFGAVYAGSWKSQSVAIKLIEGVTSESDRQQLIREAQIMSRMHNDKITPLVGACLESGRMCLLMSLMEKGNLLDNLATLTPVERLEMAKDLALGLLYLHEQGIIHSDIKPENVLINRYNQAKWSDFGLAKTYHASIMSIGPSGTSKSVAWQAPESWQTRAALTTASDIYSFGMLLWSLMTGVLPYRGVAEQALMARIAAGYRETLEVKIPAECSALIAACWHHDPLRRPRAADIVRVLNTVHSLLPPSPYARPASPDGRTLYQSGTHAEDSGQSTEAYNFYTHAASKGYADAYNRLGCMTLTGSGRHPIDKAEAKTFFERGMAAGDAKAAFNLARMYEKGDGVSKSAELALTLYKSAQALDSSNERIKDKVALLSALIK